MERFPKAAMQITKEMASALSGILMATSIYAIIRMVNAMAFKYCIIKLLETQLMPNIKMVL